MTTKLASVRANHYPQTPRNVAALAVIREFTHPGVTTPESMAKSLTEAGIPNADAHVRYLTRMGVLKWH